jgi:hypothetical protein
MTRRKPGRPSQGLSETRMEIRLPKVLAKAAKAAAKAEGLLPAEWWRRAAQARIDGRAAMRAEWRRLAANDKT